MIILGIPTAWKALTWITLTWIVFYLARFWSHSEWLQAFKSVKGDVKFNSLCSWAIWSISHQCKDWDTDWLRGFTWKILQKWALNISGLSHMLCACLVFRPHLTARVSQDCFVQSFTLNTCEITGKILTFWVCRDNFVRHLASEFLSLIFKLFLSFP